MYWTERWVVVHKLTRISDVPFFSFCRYQPEYKIKACAMSGKYAHDSKGNECNVALDVYIINILK